MGRGKSPPTLHKSAPFLYYAAQRFSAALQKLLLRHWSGALVIRYPLKK